MSAALDHGERPPHTHKNTQKSLRFCGNEWEGREMLFGIGPGLGVVEKFSSMTLYGIFSFFCLCLFTLYSYIPPRRVLYRGRRNFPYPRMDSELSFFFFSGKFPSPNSFKLDQSLLDLASFDVT